MNTVHPTTLRFASALRLCLALALLATLCLSACVVRPQRPRALSMAGAMMLVHLSATVQNDEGPATSKLFRDIILPELRFREPAEYVTKDLFALYGVQPGYISSFQGSVYSGLVGTTWFGIQVAEKSAPDTMNEQKKGRLEVLSGTITYMGRYHVDLKIAGGELDLSNAVFSGKRTLADQRAALATFVEKAHPGHWKNRANMLLAQEY